MPLKLNLGLSKKVGLPDYGSLGATCHVEVELEASLLQNDLDAFHRHVKHAYVACSQAVNDELTRQRAVEPHATNGHDRLASAEHANGNASARTNGNGQRHQASPKQLSYIRQLAGQISGLGVRQLDELTQQMFAKTLDELTGFDASALIDQLKAIKSGQIELQDVLLGESR